MIHPKVLGFTSDGPLRRVGTFAEKRRTGSWRVDAYTRWYSTTWPGCIEYDVHARSGAEAKRIAKQARLSLEIERGRKP